MSCSFEGIVETTKLYDAKVVSPTLKGSYDLPAEGRVGPRFNRGVRTASTAHGPCFHNISFIVTKEACLTRYRCSHSEGVRSEGSCGHLTLFLSTLLDTSPISDTQSQLESPTASLLLRSSNKQELPEIIFQHGLRTRPIHLRIPA